MSIRAVLAASTSLSLPDRKIIYYTTSGTFIAPYDMDVIIDAIGASATGAIRAGSPYGNASGGGAGGHTKKKVSLKAGDTLTIGIGAGGAIKTVSAADVTAGFARYDGNDGGNTTVTGPNGLNLIAGGGKGGKNTAINVAAAGGIGGTATGGDVNMPGGRGGNIAAKASTAGNNNSTVQASGGGAVDLGFGAFHGGDITSTGLNAAANYVSATAGAGPAEHGTTESGGAPFVSSGAGATLLLPVAGGIMPGRSILGLVNTVGPAGGAQTSGNPSAVTPAGPLAGGGSAINYGNNTGTCNAGAGGLFSGGGGAAQSNSASGTAGCNAGAGGQFGGGSGGAATIFMFAGCANTGAGASGLVVLELLA